MAKAFQAISHIRRRCFFFLVLPQTPIGRIAPDINGAVTSLL